MLLHIQLEWRSTQKKIVCYQKEMIYYQFIINDLHFFSLRRQMLISLVLILTYYLCFVLKGEFFTLISALFWYLSRWHLSPLSLEVKSVLRLQAMLNECSWEEIVVPEDCKFFKRLHPERNIYFFLFCCMQRHVHWNRLDVSEILGNQKNKKKYQCLTLRDGFWSECSTPFFFLIPFLSLALSLPNCQCII